MRLYAISDRKLLANDEYDRRAALVELACAWARNKIDYIQIREKDLVPSDLRDLTRQIVAAVRKENRTTRVLLNGPAQIALEAHADGVHLPANALPNAAAEARSLFASTGRDAILSHACHSLSEALRAKEESQRNAHATVNNTLILFAPVFEKVTSEGILPGLGLESLRAAVEAARPIPVFALGGVALENSRSCIATGAAGIAGIRLFLEQFWKNSQN